MLIILPLPDRRLFPNRSKGLHWALVGRLRKNARYDAGIATKAAMNVAGEPGDWTAADVRLKFWFKDRRNRDRDNLIASCKAYLDGIADAGLVRNDSGMYPYPPEWDVDAKNPRLEVTITKRV